MESDAISVVSALLEAGNVDTVYRDIYLERARTLLSPALSLEDFQRIERERGALAELPLAIARAGEGELAPGQRAEPAHGGAQAGGGGQEQAHRDRPRRLRRHRPLGRAVRGGAPGTHGGVVSVIALIVARATEEDSWHV